MPFRSRFRYAAASLVILAAAGAMAWPAPADAESLSAALADAYRDNPTLKAARAQLRATNERVPQALSNWRPQVSINGSVSRQKIQDEDQFNQTEATTTPRDVTLQIEQPVYRGGQTVAGTERAEFEVKSERNRVVNTQQDVFQRAIEAYMNVWRDREILRLNKQNVRSLQDQLNAAKQRFERGVATRTDVAQARTRLARAKARRETTEGQLTNSMAVYEEVIGHPPGDLDYPENMANMPANVDAAVARAAENNPQVRAARFASRAADREVRQRTGQLLPTVTLTGEVSRREQQLRNSDETQSAEVRLGVQIPLYQSGQVTSQVRQAKQTASQRRIQVAEAKRRARQQARSAWGRLRAARRQIDQRRRQVEAAEVAVKGAEEELKVGSRTVFDVLDAEQDLFNAQIGLVRARRDIAVARFSVLQAVGGLTARSLELDVKLHDAEEAYDAVRGLWWGLSAPQSDTGDLDDAAPDQPAGDTASETSASASPDPEPTGADADTGAAASTNAGGTDGDGQTDDTQTADTQTDDTQTGDGQTGNAKSREPSDGDGMAADAGSDAADAGTPDTGTSDTGMADGAGAAADGTTADEGESAEESETRTARASEPDAPAGDTGGARTGDLDRAAIEEMERLLKAMDFQTGAVDGKVDPKTRAAIGRFQQAAGLSITYEPSMTLLEEMRAVRADME